MTYLFDGKAKAKEIEKELISHVQDLNKKGINPKLVSILVGDDPASKLYLSLKKAAATAVGASLEIRDLPSDASTIDIIDMIKELNVDETVYGIMLQLPLPDNFSKEERDQIIDNIISRKDVDGMKEDSPYLTPVVKAIILALKEASHFLPNDREAKVAVVGSRGFVGSRVISILDDMGYITRGVDKKSDDWEVTLKESDVIVSATGEENLVTGNLINENSILIDVGSPKPDVDKDSVLDKASFLSPVPGGIGPLTVVLLIENLIESTS